jgi:hypothetical protein
MGLSVSHLTSVFLPRFIWNQYVWFGHHGVTPDFHAWKSDLWPQGHKLKLLVYGKCQFKAPIYICQKMRKLVVYVQSYWNEMPNWITHLHLPKDVKILLKKKVLWSTHIPAQMLVELSSFHSSSSLLNSSQQATVIVKW